MTEPFNVKYTPSAHWIGRTAAGKFGVLVRPNRASVMAGSPPLREPTSGHYPIICRCNQSRYFRPRSRSIAASASVRCDFR